jgi:hypothetical protein
MQKLVYPSSLAIVDWMEYEQDVPSEFTLLVFSRKSAHLAKMHDVFSHQQEPCVA